MQTAAGIRSSQSNLLVISSGSNGSQRSRQRTPLGAGEGGYTCLQAALAKGANFRGLKLPLKDRFRIAGFDSVLHLAWSGALDWKDSQTSREPRPLGLSMGALCLAHLPLRDHHLLGPLKIDQTGKTNRSKGRL